MPIVRILVLMWLVCWSTYSQSNDKVVVGAPHWINYTNTDGSGLYFELLKRVFGETNLSLSASSYHQAITEFEQGELDIVIGVNPEEVATGYIPKWHIDYEKPLKAFYQRGKHSINHVTDLKSLQLSWIKGFQFELYVNKNPTYQSVKDRYEGLALLKADKVDAFIGYDYFDAENVTPGLSSFELMYERPIYIAFNNSNKGQMLANLFDREMERLYLSGELKALYGKEYQRANFDSPAQEQVVLYTDDSELLNTRDSGLRKSHIGVYAITELLGDLLPQYAIEYKQLTGLDNNLANDERELACVKNAIQTPKRMEKYAISGPVYLYQTVRLYSTKPLTITEPFSLTSLFEQYPEYTIGVPAERNYGRQLNAALANSSRNVVKNAAYDDSLAAKQLAKGRFDFLLETPGDIESYWAALDEDNAPLFKYQLTDSPPLIIGRIICKSNEAGQRFVSSVNKALTKLKITSPFYIAQHDLMSPISDEKFQSAYQEVFH